MNAVMQTGRMPQARDAASLTALAARYRTFALALCESGDGR